MTGRLDVETRFWAYANRGPADACWEWTGARHERGYGVLTVRNGPRHKKLLKAHRISWQMANGRPPRLPILHSCDNPPCVNPAHLREGTIQQNHDDAVARGRTLPGERNGRARLTAKQVAAIRADPASSLTLAPRYGVAASTIRYARRRETWMNSPPALAASESLKDTKENPS